MLTILLILLWCVSLGVAILGAEMLVRALVGIGHHVGLSSGLLGLVVALGADGPEVTSALVALTNGSQDIGLGVVVGSNIYNLAGLLGLAAVLAGGVASNRHRLAVDGSTNLLLTILLVVLLQAVIAHTLAGVILLLVLAGYVAILAVPERSWPVWLRPDETEAESVPEPSWDTPRLVIFAVLSAAAIIVGSYLLVRTSISLGPKVGISSSIMGTFILPVATSLPNSWAAISLARKGLASAAIAATFNSNSINAAMGAGLPALFLSLHASQTARTFDASWLLGMTLVAMVLLATRRTMARWEGGLLLALYAAFVAFRLVFF